MPKFFKDFAKLSHNNKKLLKKISVSFYYINTINTNHRKNRKLLNNFIFSSSVIISIVKILKKIAKKVKKTKKKVKKKLSLKSIIFRVCAFKILFCITSDLVSIEKKRNKKKIKELQ